MAPKYKLIYFNSRGLGEMSRLCFAAAGVEFEDIRNENIEAFRRDWKEKTPFGTGPCLEIDGKHMLSESGTIVRYVAINHGLAGKDNIEAGMADMVAELFLDGLKSKAMLIYMEQDPAKKEEIKKKFLTEHVPNTLNNVEKVLQKNKGGAGFLVGDALTYPDLIALTLINDWLAHLNGGQSVLSDKWPLLKAHLEKVANVPAIRSYLANRPPSKD